MRLLLLIFICLLSTNSFSQLFGPQIEISESTAGARDVYTADLDGDGDMDVLSASAGDDKIAWYVNDGTGAFGNQQIISTNADGGSFSIGKLSVFVADLDGDNDIDVLSSSPGDDKIAWYANDGTGVFGGQQVISTNAVGVQSMYAADLDGDGDIDVLSASPGDNKLAWYANDGSGVFGSQQVINTNIIVPKELYVSDLDGDGDMDVLTSSHTLNDKKIVWYENTGTGTFGSEQVISTNVEELTSVSSSDLDGDGDMDVLSASRGDDKIAWYANDGSGVFGSQQLISTSADQPWSAYATDLDSDGDIDVLSASWDDDKIAWYANDGSGVFGGEQLISTNADGAVSAYASDLDGDGDIDVLSASVSDDKIAWYANDGAGIFGSEQVVSVSETNGPGSVYAADLDSDGDMDVLSASWGDNKIAWYENDGTGGFGNQQVISTSADGALSVYASDLDGDGDIDILSASSGDDKIAWYTNNGSGVFSSEQVISSNANGTRSVYASDLDGDGDMDVISTSYSNDKIVWYENNGSGVFSSEQVISNGAYGAWYVYATDLDNDGDNDVLSALYDVDKIVWYENNGTGDFGNEDVIISDEFGAQSVFAADLDGDLDMDVLSASWGSDKIAWYENGGTGNFGNQQVISTNADGAEFVYASDLDGDGDMDVLSASSNDNKIAWYENDGLGVFGNEQLISVGVNGPKSVHSADIDGDGYMDVLSASVYDDKIAWYENLLGCIDIEACNYSPDAEIDDGNCCYTQCGCTDSAAENYLESATCEDNSCMYIEGCSNLLAINYNSSATIDDNSCEFIISGIVFYDENGNGSQDENEYGLSDQEVSIQQQGLLLFTDDQGNYTFTAGEGQFIIEVEIPDVFPFPTSDNSILISTNDLESTTVNFGLTNDVPNYEVEVNFFPDGNTFLCNTDFEYNIYFQNLGNIAISGVLEIEYDELFQSYEEITPIDSVNGNKVYMSFENLLPGHSLLYDIDLITPTVDFIGEYVTSTARVYGYYEGEQVAFGEDSIHMEITCAYDPNDKQAYPLGYTDEHWLLPETGQEFLVRFQNTGNAPAQDVRIQDTIDVNFDLSTFKLVANSHSAMTTIDEETRVVDFFFENIQLPDSVNNEPESHGLVSYAITPYADLPIGTELNNTAYIYFDTNEAIVTNTTWTTIHECGGESLFDVSSSEICIGESVIFTSSYENVEEYQWITTDLQIGNEATLEQSFTGPGEYTIQLIAENPLCMESSEQTITVYEIPVAQITENGTILTASEGTTYQWLLNGEPIEGATSQAYEAFEDGSYSVEITNGVDCSSTSAEVMIVHINELDAPALLVYPNPMVNSAYLEFNDAQNRAVKLLDSNGKQIRAWNKVSVERLEIEKGNLPSGNYIVQVIEGEKEYSVSLIIK